MIVGLWVSRPCFFHRGHPTFEGIANTRGGTIAMNRVHYGAVAAGALLLTLPGSLRQEPTNPAAAVAKSPILVRAEQMRWEACSAALPRGPQCATLEGDRTVANVPFTYRLKIPDGYRIP